MLRLSECDLTIDLRELSLGILSYFGVIQNYLEIEGNLKMHSLLREKNIKEIVITHIKTIKEQG